MRDPKRIDKFCDELKALWHCVPDWRFGQLMCNMLGEYTAKTKCDVFFVEDDELIDFFIEYMQNTPYYESFEAEHAILRKLRNGVR